MNDYTINLKISILSLLLLVAQPGQAQDKPNVYCNPLTLNGHPINYDTFALNSRGVLALVEGNPVSKSHKPIPFRAYLRRAGIVLKRGLPSETQAVYSVQLDELLPLARFGDELVIEPVSDQRAEQGYPHRINLRRVIKLKTFNLLALDGC